MSFRDNIEHKEDKPLVPNMVPVSTPGSRNDQIFLRIFSHGGLCLELKHCLTFSVLRTPRRLPCLHRLRPRPHADTPLAQVLLA